MRSNVGTVRSSVNLKMWQSVASAIDLTKVQSITQAHCVWVWKQINQSASTLDLHKREIDCTAALVQASVTAHSCATANLSNTGRGAVVRLSVSYYARSHLQNPKIPETINIPKNQPNTNLIFFFLEFFLYKSTKQIK
jgi:hypothetical protein